MRTRNFKTSFILYTLLITLGFSACRKKKTQEPSPTPTGIFELHLHTNIDSNEVSSYNVIYTTGEGRKVSLTMAQLYITDIQLVYPDGSTFDFSGNKILKVLEKEVYLVGDAPAGIYKSIRFKVGLDATTNLLNPTTLQDSTILNRPEMWFSGTAQPDGYVFINLQGKIDTTTNASGTISQMQPFIYKIGTNANYRQVTMPDKIFSIVKDQAEFGHITIDYNKLFSGIKLNQPSNLSVTSAAANSAIPATWITNNIPSMFSYEE